MRLVGGRSLLIDGPSATLLPETKCFKYQLLDLFDVFEDSSFWFIVLKSGGENQTPFFYHRGSSNFSTLNLTEFQWWLESKQKIIPFGYYSLCGTWFFEDSLKTQMGEVLIFQSSQGPTRCEFFMVLRGGGEWNLREIPYLFAILEDCRETFPRVNKKKRFISIFPHFYFFFVNGVVKNCGCRFGGICVITGGPTQRLFGAEEEVRTQRPGPLRLYAVQPLLRRLSQPDAAHEVRVRAASALPLQRVRTLLPAEGRPPAPYRPHPRYARRIARRR